MTDFSMSELKTRYVWEAYLNIYDNVDVRLCYGLKKRDTLQRGQEVDVKKYGKRVFPDDYDGRPEPQVRLKKVTEEEYADIHHDTFTWVLDKRRKEKK
jgi:hypothetical protein